MLDVEDVEALLRVSQDDRVLECAQAWLSAYRLACWLGFRPSVARSQGAAAWDRTAAEIAELMSPDAPHVN